MSTTYKKFEIKVEPVGGGTAARAQLLREGSVVPFSHLGDGAWVYADGPDAALNLARHLIDKMEAQPHSPCIDSELDQRRRSADPDAPTTNPRLTLPGLTEPRPHGEIT